jgi:hypothetical protein
MNFYTDLLSILVGCLALYAKQQSGRFVGTLVLGVIIAALCWMACSQYSRLWNKRFHLTFGHYFWCSLAAVLTLVFVVLFPALQYTRDVALASIEVWRLQIAVDPIWSAKTFREAYYAVHRQTGDAAEDFTGYPPPEAGGTTIPCHNEITRLTYASIYANDAAQYFSASRPFLGKVLTAHASVPKSVIVENLQEYFAGKIPLRPGETIQTYQSSRAIDLAADEIKKGLDEQVPRVVSISRWTVIGLFILAQAVPFGIIGWAAYRDIRVWRATQ